MEKEIIKAIKLLLKDIRKNGISKEHRHSDIDWDCPECRFKILEGGLEWYLNLRELDIIKKRKDPKKCKHNWVFHHFTNQDKNLTFTGMDYWECLKCGTIKW
jgi:rubredoxin